MSKKDQLSGRGPLSGNKRSHAMNHSRRSWGINLQTIRLEMPNGEKKKIRVSAKTIKTLKKQAKSPIEKTVTE